MANFPNMRMVSVQENNPKQETAMPLMIGGAPVSPMTDSQGTLIPHAYSFATIINSASRVYSHRSDEALKHSHTNALAARRDCYLRALEQERILPSSKNRWALKVDNENDPFQKQVAEGLTRCIEATYRWRRMLYTLNGAIWYGRYGCQVKWARDPQIDNMYRVVRHIPVNGDKIQYQWYDNQDPANRNRIDDDDTPCVMLNTREASRIAQTDREAIVYTMAGAMALRLYKPEYRDRFIIHKHIVDDADYFEGEMAGSVHGVGLRSIMYWTYQLRMDMMDWMVTSMETVGTTELAIVNFEAGNAEAKDEAERQAKLLPGKTVIVMPRARGDKYQAVEFLPLNTAGVEALMKIIDTYFDKHIERLWIGQGLTGDGGAGHGSGGGDVAGYYQDTKYQLLDWDADNLAETLTDELVKPCMRLNYPEADFPVRLIFSVPNPDAVNKLQTAKDLKELGIDFKAEDIRDVTGFSKPEEGDEAVGGSELFGSMMEGATGGGNGLDVGGLLDRMPTGSARAGGSVGVQELLDRMARMQADLDKLLRG